MAGGLNALCCHADALRSAVPQPGGRGSVLGETALWGEQLKLMGHGATPRPTYRLGSHGLGYNSSQKLHTDMMTSKLTHLFPQIKTLATASLGAMLLFTVACTAQDGNGSASTGGDAAVTEPTTAEPDASGEAVVVPIALTAEGRAFFLDGQGDSNPDIVVQQGDTVNVTLCVTGGTHDWVVDEFDAATAVISAGGECSTVEFVADQVGEFDYYCSVGNHRAEGMVGRFIVE